LPPTQVVEHALSPDESRLRDRARAFAMDVVAKGAAERDEEERFPEEVLAAAAREGYLGMLVPKEYGGTAYGNFRQCLVLEEIARADASTHVTISVHNSLVTAPILQWGNEEQKRRWLPRLARGELIGAYALTEADAGSDAAALVTSARREGREWILDGAKMWITTGRRADLAIVFARTDPEAPKAKGISAFLVELASPGVSAGKKEPKLGIRASETVALFLDGVRVPEDNLLGVPGHGFACALHTLNGGRVGIGTQAVGIAQAALEAVILGLRGRVPERGASFGTQDQDFAIASMAARVEAARLLVWRAARMRDAAVEHIREASMAKLFASEVANDAVRTAMEILGPPAYEAGGVAERLFRDARITEIYEGTTEVQKLVIARNLSGA
jgi:butyryl-CoA dehydrogenase